MTGHRTVRIVCVGLLLAAAAFITGGTSAVATGDVTITVAQAGSPVASADAQGDFSLTVKATNNTGGPVNDTATLSLQLPAGVAPTSGCSGSSSPYSCDVALVLAATDSDVTVGSIALHADPSSAGSYPSQAGSASTTGGLSIDPFAYDINVAGQADLGVALTGVPTGDVVAGGSGFTAKATVTNYGPSDSGGDWTATVTLPSADLEYGTMPAGCGVDGTGLVATCNGSTLSPNGSTEFDLPVSAPHDATAGDRTITAAVQPGATPEGGNTNADSDQATAHVVAQADLGVAWSGLPTANQVAGQDSFNATATVKNYGPSDSGSGWSATLTVPTGFAFTSATGCAISVDKFTATCPTSGVNLDPTDTVGSSTKAFPVTVSVLHNAAVGNDTIGATVAPDSSVPQGANSHNDSDSKTVPVIAVADLRAVSMTSAGTIKANGSDTATVTYTFKNAGPSDAQGATFTVPSSLQIVGPQPTVTAPIEPGQSRPVTLTIKANPCDGHGAQQAGCSDPRITGQIHVTNSASVVVAPPATDPDSVDNSCPYNESQANQCLHTGDYVTVNTVSAPVTDLRSLPSDTNIVLSWQAPPANSGGPAIDASNPYQITVTRPAGTQLPSNCTPLLMSTTQCIINVPTSATLLPCRGSGTVCYNVQPLTLNQSYTFDVRVQNVVGLSDPTSITDSTSGDSKSTLVAKNTSVTFGNCKVATTAQPVCVQYTVPAGVGGLAGITGNVQDLGNLCAPFTCNGGGVLDTVAPQGFLDPKNPIVETINWDVLISPLGKNSLVFWPSPAFTGQLPSCNKSTIASPNPCIRKLVVLQSNSNPNEGGDVHAEILFTSDKDALSGKH